MFYIYADGQALHDPTDTSAIALQARLTMEMGKAGSLTFGLPHTSYWHSRLKKLKTVITVESDGVEIFRGRVLSEERGFNNVKAIYCEGNLAYLVDSVQKAEAYRGGAHALFQKILNAHNARVEASKRFLLGKITIENRDVVLSGQSDRTQDEETGAFDYKQIAINSIANTWKTTYDYISTCLIDYCGGYLRTRREANGVYLDYVLEYGSSSTQSIEFGKNLLDIREEASAEDLFTVLIPLGNENLTIAEVNDGSDELVDADAVNLYGRILRTHVFDSVTSPSTLLENGKRYLASNSNLPITVTIKAVDLHLLNPDIHEIYVGDVVSVKSTPHQVVGNLTCTKIEYDLSNAANTVYTFGTPKQTLTERYRKDISKTQDSSGGGAASAASEAAKSAGGGASKELEEKLNEFYDAWVNVDPDSAYVDIGALSKVITDMRTTLTEVGIDLDGVTGNINIRTVREELTAAGEKISLQGAHIDLLQAETEAQIDLVVSRIDYNQGIESEHFAQITMRANSLESSIGLKADKVTVQAMDIRLNALYNDVGALEGDLNTATASISALANSTESKISAVATRTTGLESRSASLELRVSNTESSINLKADKITLNSLETNINSKITNINSEITNVKKLIADEVAARIASVTVIDAFTVRASSSIQAPSIFATSSLTVGGKAVATQDWVWSILSNFSQTNHTHSNYASASHSHPHSHSVTSYGSLQWGHTHNVSSSGTVTLGVNNYAIKQLEVTGYSNTST